MTDRSLTDGVIEKFAVDHDLCDADLDYLMNNLASDTGFLRPLIREIRQRRAAACVNEKRVRQVVREAGHALIAAYVSSSVWIASLSGTGPALVNALADQAAAQLAGEQRLTREEREALQWAITVCLDHGGTPDNEHYLTVLDHMFSGCAPSSPQVMPCKEPDNG